jgi:hypothetical protein
MVVRSGAQRAHCRPQVSRSVDVRVASIAALLAGDGPTPAGGRGREAPLFLVDIAAPASLLLLLPSRKQEVAQRVHIAQPHEPVEQGGQIAHHPQDARQKHGRCYVVPLKVIERMPNPFVAPQARDDFLVAYVRKVSG